MGLLTIRSVVTEQITQTQLLTVGLIRLVSLARFVGFRQKRRIAARRLLVPFAMLMRSVRLLRARLLGSITVLLHAVQALFRTLARTLPRS